MSLIDRVFSWYIPPEFGRDATMLARARSLVALSGAVVLAGPTFAALYAWLGHPRGAMAIVATMALILPGVKIALALRSLPAAQVIVFGAMTAMLAYLNWTTAARLDLSIACWFLVPPLLVTFAGGPRTGALALVATLALVGAMEAARAAGVAVPESPITDPRLLNVASTFGLIPFVGIVAIAFQAGREQSDRERETHLRTVSMLVEEVGRLSAQVTGSVNEVADALARQRERAEAVRSHSDAGNELAGRLQSSTAALADESRSAEATAREGADVVGSAIRRAVALAEMIQRADGLVGGLQARSRQISEATDKIRQLAFQTNILALNATVEAAHAGAHGRGFAVVADSVRQLAGEASEAAAEISRELGRVIDHIGETAKLLGDGSAMAESGRQEAAKASESLTGILESVRTFTLEADRLQQVGREQLERNGELRRHAAEMEQGIGQVADGSATIRDAMAALNARLEQAA